MPDSEPPTVGLRLSAPLNVSAHVVIKDQRRACVEAVPRGLVHFSDSGPVEGTCKYVHQCLLKAITVVSQVTL